MNAIPLDPNTLTLYLVAAAMSSCLSLVMLAFARFQPGTLVARNFAIAILMLAAGFFGAGCGPALPRWAIVIGTNLALLSAGAIMHAGFAAFSEQRKAVPDRFGWAVVALSAAPFWYWGLIEPNGNYRSAVFSLAAAAITVRTALLLLRAARQRTGDVPLWAMTILFGVLTAWMAARGVLSLVAETPPVGQRGANPTAWITVFGFIVLVSLMTACTLWMEINRLRAGQKDGAGIGVIESSRSRLILLWGTVAILNIAIISEVGIAYTKFYADEKARLIRTTEVANDSFAEHTQQLANQVDTILGAVREFYLHTHSLANTDAFIDSMRLDRSFIDNIYLISSAGEIVIARDPAAKRLSVADREYFSFHRATPEDRLFISTVERGRVTGEFHFRITRRIDNPDGSFGGVVLATIKPEAFTRHYLRLSGGVQNLAALIGTTDRKLRARVPEPLPEHWQVPIDTPLWSALEKSPAGFYESASPLDGIRRLTTYKKVGDLPLVMITGFSDADLTDSVLERTRWLILTALIFLASTLVLAVLLTLEILRREEQDSFLSMLSHELKTPLSVIRMALGMEGIPGEIKEIATRAVLNMNAVVDRCLQSDRLRRGRMLPALGPCRIEEILAELETASATPSRLAIQADKLPACRSDSQMLRIILDNLLDNALKYGAPRGTVRVVAAPASDKGQAGVRIEVANAPGTAGLPDPGRVFKKYYRAAAARSKTGSGLGLFISAGLARKIGARLRYRPSADEVIFELWIPL
jgi:signal transduction histidine kinase